MWSVTGFFAAAIAVVGVLLVATMIVWLVRWRGGTQRWIPITGLVIGLAGLAVAVYIGVLQLTPRHETQTNALPATGGAATPSGTVSATALPSPQRSDVRLVPPPAPGPASKPVPNAITEPASDAVVDKTIIVKGTISSVAGDHLAVLMLLYGNCYFPERVTLNANSWSSVMSIGGDEAAGMSFILRLMDLGPKGVTALEQYEADQQASGTAVGICSTQELTDRYQATSLAAVHITRRSAT